MFGVSDLASGSKGRWCPLAISFGTTTVVIRVNSHNNGGRGGNDSGVKRLSGLGSSGAQHGRNTPH